MYSEMLHNDKEIKAIPLISDKKDYESLINKVLHLSFDLYNSEELEEQIEKRYEKIK